MFFADTHTHTHIDGLKRLTLPCAHAHRVTKKEFVKAVHRVSALVKPGGCLLFSTVEPKDTTSELHCYPIGDRTYTEVAVDRSFIESAFRKDFQEVTVKQLPADADMPNRIKNILLGSRLLIFLICWVTLYIILRAYYNPPTIP